MSRIVRVVLPIAAMAALFLTPAFAGGYGGGYGSYADVSQYSAVLGAGYGGNVSVGASAGSGGWAGVTTGGYPTIAVGAVGSSSGWGNISVPGCGCDSGYGIFEFSAGQSSSAGISSHSGKYHLIQ